jgi:uncharacterized protein (TIGR03118 family)
MEKVDALISKFRLEVLSNEESQMIRLSAKTLILTMFTLAIATIGAYAKMMNHESAYVETNIVSDLSSEKAILTDSDLLNSWGIAFFPGGPFWINDNNAGLSTLYTGAGVKLGLKVTIPPPSNAPGTTATPTGIVWNGNPLAFNLTSTGNITAPALFIFDTEDGTISAWNGNSGTTAQLVKDETDPNNGAVYKGLALGVSATKGILLYATNFRSGHIDVFGADFSPTTVGGSFSDPNIPTGFAPFGISNIHGDLFVTYAMQNASKHDDVGGKGNGFVDIFDTDGHLLHRFATRGHLNSPWGLTPTSFNFGQFSGDILIGNFGDGAINAYSNSGEFLGQLEDTADKAIKIDGLWALNFGGAAGSSPDVLYFTSGPNGEKDGLFGSLAPSM